MKVLHFGPVTRPLFGALHTPQRLRPRSGAILLCNPFGEEAARAHRLYRVLATQLERSGYPVLRFDYHGTGDSSGESHEISIADWISDIALAIDELGAAAGARKIVAIGLGLGATLAALAVVRERLRVHHLVLWDPLVDGRAYLQDLAAAHRASMREELPAWEDRLVLADGIPNEAFGMPIGAALGAELAAIDLASEDLSGTNLTVISTKETPAMARLRARLGDSPFVRWIDMPASVAWNSDAALNAAVVPMDIVQALVKRVEDVAP